MSKIDKLIVLILITLCEMLTKYSDKFYFGDIIQIKHAIKDMEENMKILNKILCLFDEHTPKEHCDSDKG